MKIVNSNTQYTVAEDVINANTFLKRLKGLLGTKSLGAGKACMITPCSQVHTFGMNYSIDVIFLDKEKRIVGISKDLRPNRLSKMYFKSHSVLEFMAGQLENCSVGDQLQIIEG